MVRILQNVPLNSNLDFLHCCCYYYYCYSYSYYYPYSYSYYYYLILSLFFLRLSFTSPPILVYSLHSPRFDWKIICKNSYFLFSINSADFSAKTRNYWAETLTNWEQSQLFSPKQVHQLLLLLLLLLLSLLLLALLLLLCSTCYHHYYCYTIGNFTTQMHGQVCTLSKAMLVTQ